ncbi:MAG: hypothetical protein ACI9CF_001692 [Candidatus Omnitrophota bacterium]|jgi:hypothetical protein
MIKRFSATMVCLALMAVFSMPFDCGCSFAHASVAKKVEQKVSGHCDHGSEAASKEVNDKCCVGCLLETIAANAQPAQLIFTSQIESFQPSISLSKSLLNNNKTYLSALNIIFNNPESRGVPNLRYNQPTYLSFGSFLV